MIVKTKFIIAENKVSKAAWCEVLQKTVSSLLGQITSGLRLTLNYSYSCCRFIMLIMPRRTVHRRHTVVCSLVRPSVSPSDLAYLHDQ